MVIQKWMEVARSYNGLREYPGAANNPTIMGWAKALGTKILGIAYGADSVPWCALFVSHCMKQAGFVPPAISIRASSWSSFGQPLKKAVYGCVAVFQRPGGGHVAFVVGESKTAYKVLGGNQGDAVNETWIDKSRCVALRYPIGAVVPAEALPFYTAAGKLSSNEA